MAQAGGKCNGEAGLARQVDEFDGKASSTHPVGERKSCRRGPWTQLGWLDQAVVCKFLGKAHLAFCENVIRDDQFVLAREVVNTDQARRARLEIGLFLHLARDGRL